LDKSWRLFFSRGLRAKVDEGNLPADFKKRLWNFA